MKVTIKAINHELEIKNSGVEFSVRDSSGKHRGDFYVRKSGIVWCRGKSSVKSGKSLSWEKFIRLAENKFRPL